MTITPEQTDNDNDNDNFIFAVVCLHRTISLANERTNELQSSNYRTGTCTHTLIKRPMHLVPPMQIPASAFCKKRAASRGWARCWWSRAGLLMKAGEIALLAPHSAVTNIL